MSDCCHRAEFSWQHWGSPGAPSAGMFPSDELAGEADPPVSPVWSAGTEMSILGLKIFLDEALCNWWSWQWEALGPGGGKETRMTLLGAFSSEKY